MNRRAGIIFAVVSALVWLIVEKGDVDLLYAARKVKDWGARMTRILLIGADF